MTIAEKLDLANTIIAAIGVAITAIIGFKGLRTLRMAPVGASRKRVTNTGCKLRRWFGTQGEYDALKKAGKIDRDKSITYLRGVTTVKMSNEQWKQIRHHVPMSRERDADGETADPGRHVFEVVLWILYTGTQWSFLPHTIRTAKPCTAGFKLG